MQLSLNFTITAFLINLVSALPLATTKYDAFKSNKDDSADPNIKMVLFRTGVETPEQLALVPKIQAVARLYGANKIEERELPIIDSNTYESIDNNELLQVTWYKIQVTRDVMISNPLVEWILAFELSALPTDGSAAINFAALVSMNPSTSVFLKRVGSGFGMAMYKNDKATREVIEKIWAKRSASSTVTAAFASFTFWNPLILSKVKFI